MKRLKVFGLAIICAGLWGVTGVIAQPASQPTCDNISTTVALKDCLNKAFEFAEKELTEAWRKALASIDRADHLTSKQRRQWKAKLLKAQRSWITFKDTDCRDVIAFEWWGGTGTSAAITQCLLTQTRLRTQNLRSRYRN